MAERILLDTSMLIDIFDRKGDKGLLESECYLSVISIYEYVRYKKQCRRTKVAARRGL